MTKTPLLERIVKRGRRSRTSSSSSSQSSVERENVGPIQRGRSSSTVESFNYTIIPQIQDDMRVVNVVSDTIDLRRPISPKAVNVHITARAHQPPIFRTVDQNVIEPELVRLGDIPDEDPTMDTIVWNPSTTQPSVPIIRPLSPTPPWTVVEGAAVLYDPVLHIQMHQGFHHEVWDPNICDGLVLWGRASLKSPIHLPSELIWLSLEVWVVWPRKPLGQTQPDYVCLMRNNTLVSVKPSTTTSQNVDEDPQRLHYRPAEYPTPSLIPTHAPCDLEVRDIKQHPSVQTCLFKLVLPVGDPILFRDGGAGDLTRTLKIRSKGVVRATSNDVISVRQLTEEVNLTVNVLKTPRFLVGIKHSSA